MKESTKQNPLSLSCDKCGAPMEFDIIKQNYQCLHCGNTEFLNFGKEKIENWCKINEKEIKKAKSNISAFSCPDCGANVNSNSDSETLTCSFCSSTMIKTEFFKNKASFPTAIIPFNITQDEADKILSNWLYENKLKKEAKKIQAGLQKLRGIYLPYQLFTGPLSAEVTRYKGSNNIIYRKFSVNSYVNQKLIVACDNVPNDLLDEIEPFDKTKFKDFEFIYLSNIQAKTQEKSYKLAQSDFIEESENDIAKILSKDLNSKYIDCKADDKNISSVPVLLPIYYTKIDDIVIAVNGQTGKLSIFANKIKKTNPWIIKPTIISLSIILIPMLFLYVFNINDFNNFNDFWLSYGEPVLAIGGFFSFITFVYFYQQGGAIKKKKFRQTSITYQRGKNRKLESIKDFTLKNDFEKLVFTDEYEGEKQPVDIKIFPIRRIISLFFSYIIFLFLPLIITMIAYPFVESENGERLRDFLSTDMIMASGTWYIITVPFAFLFWIGYVKTNVYNYLYVKPYGSDKSYKPAFKRQSFVGAITAPFKFLKENRELIWPAILVLLVLIIIIIASITEGLFVDIPD